MFRDESLDGRHDSSRDLESRVERLSERDIPGVAGECHAHLAGHVSVADFRIRIRKAECPAGSRRPERTRAAEAPVLTWLHEAELELHLAFEAFVIEPSQRRNRRRGQQVQRILSQPEFASSSREDTVRVRNAARRGNPAAGDSSVARVL